MDRNKLLPSLVCGFGAAALTIIPGTKESGAACCLFVPLASAFSVFLYNKTNKSDLPIKTGTAIFLGLLTGIFIGLFSSSLDVIATLITHTNEFVTSFPENEAGMRELKKHFPLNLQPYFEENIQTFRIMTNEIQTKGFSLSYTVIFGSVYTFIFTVFGIIGGLLGLLLIKRRTQVK